MARTPFFGSKSGERAIKNGTYDGTFIFDGTYDGTYRFLIRFKNCYGTYDGTYRFWVQFLKLPWHV